MVHKQDWAGIHMGVETMRKEVLFAAEHGIFKGKFPSRVISPLSSTLNCQNGPTLQLVHASKRETIPKSTCCFSDGGNRKRRFLGVQHLPYQRMGSKYGEFPWSVYVQNEATVIIPFSVGRRNLGRPLTRDENLVKPSRGLVSERLKKCTSLTKL